MKKTKNQIIEKELNIPPDYQFKALHNSNFIQSNWHRNKLTALDTVLKLNKKDRVLDLGVGSGNFELYFAKKTKSIVGVDYNDGAIKFAKDLLKKKKAKNVKFYVKNINELQKNSLGKFDVVVMVDVIEHLKMQDVKKLLKVVKALLKPRGRMCIITPNFNSSWIAIEKFVDTLKLVPELGGKQHISRFNSQNLALAYQKEGYLVPFKSTFNLFSPLVPNTKASEILTKFELRIPIPIGNLLIMVAQLPE